MTDTWTAAIRFRIAGPLRFLSHAETARLWQRVCARAGLPVRYSQGFNPHPRLSLPLPRPVGVEAREELLVVKLEGEDLSEEHRAEREAALRQALALQVPEGMEVLAVELVPGNASFPPQSAEYVLPLQATVVERVRGESAKVMASDRCIVERASGEGRAPRPIDVRPFLESIRVEGGDLIVQHRTDGAGSIRVDEILQLFGLQTSDLAGPVRRINVVWETGKPQNSSEAPCMETRAEDIEDGT